MGIKVAAGGGRVAAALANAAFVGGKGRRRNEIQNQQIQAREQQKRLDWRSNESELDRDFTLNRDQINRDFTLSRDQTNHERILERNQREAEDKRLAEFDYSTMDDATREKWNKYQKIYDDARDSGDYDRETELPLVKEQLRQRQLDLLDRLPAAKKESPYGHDYKPGTTFTNESGTWVTDKDNIPKLVSPAQDKEEDKKEPLITPETYYKMYDYAFNARKSANPDGADPDSADVKADVEAKIKAYQDFAKSQEPVTPVITPFADSDMLNQYINDSLNNDTQATLPPPSDSTIKESSQVTEQAQQPQAQQSQTQQPATQTEQAQQSQAQQPATQTVYAVEDVNKYIKANKEKFNNKRASLVRNAAKVLHDYQAKVETTEPGSMQRMNLTIERLNAYEYLKEQLGDMSK